jgi:YfiH family protein
LYEKCLIPTWPAPANVVAFTTLPGAQLATLNLPSEPCWLKQVHQDTVVQANAQNWLVPEADASVTFTPNTICAIKTADCLPVLICSADGQQVAAIHAGWRSLSANIIAKTCAQFTQPLNQCLAWLGPAIGPNAFEVGADVLENFAQNGWDQQHLNLAFVAQPRAKWLGNLYHLARVTLQQQGILAANIYGGEWCTYSEPTRFYSYRRGAAISKSERMASLIWFK